MRGSTGSRFQDWEEAEASLTPGPVESSPGRIPSPTAPLLSWGSYLKGTQGTSADRVRNEPGTSSATFLGLRVKDKGYLFTSY